MTLLAVGCSEPDDPFYNGTGTLRIIVEPQGISGQKLPSADEFSLVLKAEGGETAVWTRFSDFDQNRRYLAGNYEATAFFGSEGNEGFDTPYYVGSVKFHLNEGESNVITIKPVQSSANVVVRESNEFKAAWPGCYLTLNSEGGFFIDYPAEGSPTAYLKPGTTDVYLNLPYKSEIVTLKFEKSILTRAGMTTILALEGGRDEATLKADGQTVARLELSGTVLDAPEPRFDVPFKEIELPEYVDNLASSTVKADGDLRSLTMTVNPLISGFQAVEDIQGNEISLKPYLESLGWDEMGDNTTRFTFVATTVAGRVAISPTLIVRTLKATPQITGAEGAIMGDNSTRLTIESDLEINPSKLALTIEDKPVSILSYKTLTNCKGILEVKLPEGQTPLDLVLSYGQRIVQELTIPRTFPAFDVRIDAFASRAKIQIIPENPELLEYIVPNINIAIDGKAASVLSANSSDGIITIIGLQPEMAYTCTLSLMPLDIATLDSKKELDFKTEKCLAIPNGDFEEAYDDIDCKNMNSGGVYSQTFAEIFNQQNKTTYSTKSPKEWANVNSKTYSEYATNRNTWYMQPSTLTTLEAFSGDRAVELVSVAFDPQGESIPPYLQESKPYTDYSRNIPKISYRAAGKIFLGEYAYDPKSNREIYEEGIDFSSRPTSLNGFYKFLPAQNCPADQALITIEFLDGNKVICRERLLLPVATDFTSFTLPLKFEQFGRKATRLKLMVASSKDAGTIEEETSNIQTVDDPVTSTSIGSRLIIDNLTFAY